MAWPKNKNTFQFIFYSIFKQVKNRLPAVLINRRMTSTGHASSTWRARSLAAAKFAFGYSLYLYLHHPQYCQWIVEWSAKFFKLIACLPFQLGSIHNETSVRWSSSIIFTMVSVKDFPPYITPSTRSCLCYPPLLHLTNLPHPPAQNPPLHQENSLLLKLT